MKKHFWMGTCLLLLLAGCSSGAAKTAESSPRPAEPVTLYVSSDLHWQRDRQSGGGALVVQMEYLDEMIDTLADTAARDKPAALILCGDLTNGGRLEEHEALAARLAQAQAEGVHIFVTMGNHDMDKDVSPQTLRKLYGDFGFDTAAAQDTDSMSYLAALRDDLWLLSLDCNVYGDKESDYAGTISTKTLNWVEDCLQKARQAGAVVIPFSHHNLMVHTMDNRGKNYNIDRGAELEALLMDYGVSFYLSGHRHNSFVATAERDGARLYELVTDMPGAYPHRYTSLTLQPDGTAQYAVPQLDVDAWAAAAGKTEEPLAHFAAYSAQIAAEQRALNGKHLMQAMAVPQADRAEMERYFAEFYTAFQTRTLWQKGAFLAEDPALALWQKYADKNVYSRWMPWVLENQREDNPVQTLVP